MRYFVVYVTDNASLTVLKVLLVNEEVREIMEAFGLGIGNRDIYDSEWHPLPGGFVMAGDESDRLVLASESLSGCSESLLVSPENMALYFVYRPNRQPTI